MGGILDDWFGINPSKPVEQSGDTPEVPEAPQIDYEAMLKYQLDAIRGISGLNKELMPDMVKQAREIGASFAGSLNPSIAGEFYKYLEGVNPNWKQDFIGTQQNAMRKVESFAEQLMSGKLDQETINNTMNTMAELGYSKGQFGGLASSNLARNLGLTSMQLKQQGAQLFTDAVSPLSARLLSTTTSLMPQIINPGAMASQILGYTAGALGSGQTGQQGVIGAAQTNVDLAWSSRLSGFNASMDQWANQQNLTMFNRALETQQRNNSLAAVYGMVGYGAGQITGWTAGRGGGM